MQLILFILALFWACLSAIAKHQYKCACHEWNPNKFSFMVGSTIASLVNAICCWYVINYVIN